MRTICEGKLEFTSLYFDQNRGKAMRGQIERALVELITNCDDSYREMEEHNLQTKGTIRIEIERRRKGAPSVVVVRDRAAGMSAKDMRDKLTKPGSRTSGFEKGLQRRGLYGRGAKDVTEFGRVTFESIKEDMYAICNLNPDTSFAIKESRATDDIREQLGIKRGNGTVATVEVAPRFDIPLHQTMVEKFSRYFSLRDILSSPNRRVTLIDRNKRLQKEDLLQYRYPSGKVELDEKFPVLGYDTAVAHLVIKRHERRFQEDKHGHNAPYREGRILIKSGAAIHEMTLFRFENDPYAEWFSGELVCPYIDRLIREYDDEQQRDPNSPKHSDKNPIRLLDPERDGLIKEHPFTRALFEGGEKRLKILIEREKAAAKESEKEISSDRVRKRLNDLAKKAARFMEEKFRELEEELPKGRLGALFDKYPEGLTIIPSNEYSLKHGERKTFSVIVKAPYELPDSTTVTVVSDNSGVVTRSPTVSLRVEDENRRLGRCTFVLEGVELGSQAFVSASTNDYQNVVLVEVVSPKEVPVTPPPGLSFDKGEYEVSSRKRKHAILWLNVEGIKSDRCLAQVGSSNDDVVVRPQRIRLHRTGQSFLSGNVSFEGRRLQAIAKVRAKWEHLEAGCVVRVVQREKSDSTPDLKPVDKDFGVVRAVWNKDNQNLLEIAGRHPVIRRYLGPADEDFPGKESESYLTVLAEVIAEAICQRILETKDRKHPTEDMRATDFYTEHFRLMREFLPIAHEALVSQDMAVK